MNRLERFFRKRATGLEVAIQPDGSYECFAVILEKEKRELKINHKFQFDGLDLTEKFNKKSPLVLVVNGKGVIGKKVSGSQIDNAENIAGLLLPGASSDDFYIIKKPLANNEFWVSMIRKELLDDLVQSLQAKSFFVIAIGIGPVLDTSAISLIDSSRTEINDRSYTYKIKSGSITDIVYLSGNISDSIDIEGEDLPNAHLSAFSIAFDYLLGNEDSFNLKTKDTEQSVSDLWNKNVFYYGGIASLMVFFSILLINFFFFDHYRSQHSALQSSAELSRAEYEKLVELQNKLNDKLEFVRSTGLEESSKTSFYADRLATLLPKNVLLNTLEINPLGDKIKAEEQVQFEHKKILVSGVCSKSMDINNWIKELKKYDWIKKVELKAFEAKSGEGNSNDFALEIEVL